MGPALTGSRSGFTWMPAFITYGDNNRTQMLRVPEPGHVEDRSISSAFNPYLAMAAYLAAGLDGIDRQLDPGEPNLGNLYTADLETMAAAASAPCPRASPKPSGTSSETRSFARALARSPTNSSASSATSGASTTPRSSPGNSSIVIGTVSRMSFSLSM